VPKKKIWIEESLKENFDKIPLKEVKKMIGFYEPITSKKWAVTTIDNSLFVTDSQFEAEVISSLEQIKALLLKILKERG